MLWIADGTGEVEKLGSTPVLGIHPSSWSIDGKTLICEQFSGEADLLDISAISMEGGQAMTPLLKGKFQEAHPQISPNGRWMAYTSHESGQNEIYVRPFPNVNSGKWQVSTSGGAEPRWSRDGRELFYRNGNVMLMVAVETESTFRAGLPKELFQGAYFSDFNQDWDISPDGKRFLMIKEAASSATAECPRKINIVVNWTEELKQRVPVK